MGLGFSWLPEDTIRQELADGSLKQLTLRDESERVAQIYLSFSDPEFPGRDAARLAQIIEAHAAKCAGEGVSPKKGRSPRVREARAKRGRPAP
jgi:DNA-binding transcriptional LysR family regulator